MPLPLILPRRVSTNACPVPCSSLSSIYNVIIVMGTSVILPICIKLRQPWWRGTWSHTMISIVGDAGSNSTSIEEEGKKGFGEWL